MRGNSISPEIEVVKIILLKWFPTICIVIRIKHVPNNKIHHPPLIIFYISTTHVNNSIRPYTLQNYNYLDFLAAFENCSNDKICAAKVVRQYMKNFAKVR